MASLADEYRQQQQGVKTGSRGDRSFGGVLQPNLTSTPVGKTKVTTPKPAVVKQFTEKVGRVAGQTGNIVGGGLGAAAKFTANTPRYVYEGMKPFLGGIASTVTGEKQADLRNIKTQTDSLDAQVESLAQKYKSGQINKDHYAKMLRSISESYQELSKGSQAIATSADRGNVVEGALDTASTILLGGRLSVGGTKGINAARAGAAANAPRAVKQKILQTAVAVHSTKLEKAIQNVPAVRDFVFRNMSYLGRREAQKLAGETAAQYVGREGKALAINMLLKRPIVYEMNIGGAQDVYNNLIEGDYGDAAKEAAWLSTQMLSGGPLGAAAKGFGWLNKGSRELSRGSGSYIDEISRQIGDNIAERLQHLKETGNLAQLRKEERIWRIAQETNMQMAGEDAFKAASRTLDHWADSGKDLKQVTAKEAAEFFDNWVNAHQSMVRAIKTGKVPGVKPADVGKYAVVRWDVNAKNGLAQLIENAGDNPMAVNDVIQTWALKPGNPAGQNQLLMDKIENLFNKSMAADGGGAKQLAAEIRDISAVSVSPKNIPTELKNQLGKLGYTIAQPFNKAEKITPAVDYADTRKLISAVQNGDKELFDITKAPHPALAFISRGLERAGISPEGVTQDANRALSQNVVAKLDQLNEAKGLGFVGRPGADSTGGGQVILSKLQAYMENMKPSRAGQVLVGGVAPAPAIADIRQLKVGEIVEALDGVSPQTAKAVRSSIIDGYFKVPMELRGLGDKVVDTLYKVNPIQPYYSRLQGALRYTYNPFFRTQESVETRLLSRMQARDVLWRKPDDFAGTTREWLNEASKKLDEAGIFTTGMSGEAAQDLVLGRITANITKGQKRQLAGLATAMARQRGITLDDMLLRHSDEVGDALRVVVQYPNKGVLNSSLARTMNLAFFPMRYNTKVTALAASVLAKEPPAVQMAVLNSIFDFREWTKSPEGIQWQSDNSDALQVLNWVTPVGSIEYVLSKLTKQPDSIGELGALGGLPLGVISQMLDSQGIISLNTPYVDPKTGDIVPKYIPETTKARAATAVGDVLNSLFTYPGRILGLPGKQQMINSVVREFIDTNGKDFEKRIDTERLTPLQQKWVEVLKGDTSEEAIDALYRSPMDGEFNGYTLPPLDIPVRPLAQPAAPIQRRTGLPKKQKRGKRAKAKAIPVSQT